MRAIAILVLLALAGCAETRDTMRVDVCDRALDTERAGYPCWARDTFSRASNGHNQ
jgi:hypothetical protein